MTASGTLFNVRYDRDAIWEAYINSFPEEIRQEHNCNCCKSFIRQIGGAVVIGADSRLGTIWDLTDVPEEYAASVEALAAYVRAQPVAGLYWHTDAQVGTDRNPDKVRNVIWEHFMVRIPAACKGDLAAKSGQLDASHGVLKRALDEITPESVETVLELIGQNSLYRGNDYKHLLEGLQSIRADYAALPEDLRSNFCWAKAAALPENVARVRNTAIGTLLVELSEGKELEAAVGAFERMVAPTNYKRPTSLVTPKMVEAAKQTLKDLKLLSALDRRRLDTRDLTAANALFVYRPKSSTKDVFAELAGETPVNPKTLSKVEEIGIDAFLSNVLPTARTVKVLMERQHLGNLVTLTGPTDPEANNLMKWDNSFGWSYTGGVADSIKEKVKTAGGRVEGGFMRASLAWYNFDDLDLHFKSPRGHHVYYGIKRDSHLDVHLDVDMNAGGGHSREPVENIYFGKQLPVGEYVLIVNNYAARDGSDKGFEVEIEVGGEQFNFGSSTSPRGSSSADPIRFTVDAHGKVSIADTTLSRTSIGAVKWGVKTGIWHTVKAITLSPNHWTRPTGNKHFFFLLEGCVSDEKTRPFYNEFLCEALAKDRKVSEVLAGKIEVAAAEGAELSGLGFSDTLRNHLFVEVEGTFKRTLKILF